MYVKARLQLIIKEREKKYQEFMKQLKIYMYAHSYT